MGTSLPRDCEHCRSWPASHSLDVTNKQEDAMCLLSPWDPQTLGDLQHSHMFSHGQNHLQLRPWCFNDIVTYTLTVESLTINNMICLWVVFNMEASLPWGVMVCTGLAGDLTFHMVKVPSEWLQINCFPSWCQATEWIAYTGWRILLSY